MSSGHGGKHPNKTLCCRDTLRAGVTWDTQTEYRAREEKSGNQQPVNGAGGGPDRAVLSEKGHYVRARSPTQESLPGQRPCGEGAGPIPHAWSTVKKGMPSLPPPPPHRPSTQFQVSSAATGRREQKPCLWRTRKAKEAEGVWGRSVEVLRAHACDLGASLRHVICGVCEHVQKYRRSILITDCS